MPLKNKDGSLYKLEAPIPIMKTQTSWDNYAVHNLAWDSEKKEDNTPKIKPPTPEKESFLEELERTKAPKDDIKIVETKVISEEIKKDDIEKSFIYCLPAFFKEKKDNLYGDIYKIIEYAAPTSFEGVIISQSDLSIQIWTNIDKINEGSILYPKTNFKRWWKVQGKESKKGGWILTGIPSDYQPSFEAI